MLRAGLHSNWRVCEHHSYISRFLLFCVLNVAVEAHSLVECLRHCVVRVLPVLHLAERSGQQLQIGAERRILKQLFRLSKEGSNPGIKFICLLW